MSELIKFLADGLLLVIMGVAGALAVRGVVWRRWRRLVPYAVMAGLTSLLIGKLLSLLYQPSITRPFIEHGTSAGASYMNNPGFPSDHMLFATVVVCAVYFLTPYKKSAWLLAVAALVMGTARVVAQVHTPLDIFGGIVAGVSGAVWYVRMAKHYDY